MVGRGFEVDAPTGNDETALVLVFDVTEEDGVDTVVFICEDVTPVLSGEEGNVCEFDTGGPPKWK